jgi:two-component system response regulator YesN
MLTLLIVDDEYFIREGLARDVDWASVGVTVAATAQDGREAIEKIEALHPDIVLADICMNTMSGVEMAEKLREKSNEAKIIFLSGYDDFQYARRAVELRIFDYLLKPALPEELLHCVARAAEEIARERGLRDKIAAMEQNLAAGRILAQEQFFSDLRSAALTQEEAISARARELQIPVGEHCFLAALLELDGPQDSGPRHMEKLLAASEIAVEYASGLRYRLAMIRSARLHLVLCASAGPEGEKQLDTALEKIRKGVKGLLHSTCTIGAGQAVTALRLLGESFAQAEKALEYKLTVGKDCVIHITDLSPGDAGRVIYPGAEEKRLLEAIGTLSADMIRPAISVFMEALAQRNSTRIQIRAALAELIAILTRKFLELGIDLNDSFHEFWTDPYSLLERYRSLPEIRKWLTDIILAAALALEEERRVSIKGIVAQVQQLIRENYADAELSLPMLAGKVYLSPAYLSKLYKKETGETYVEYLTRVRMDEAKKLLKQTNMRSSEIGVLVGYLNAQYFCFLFKKYTGLSPMEFREVGTAF